MSTNENNTAAQSNANTNNDQSAQSEMPTKRFHFDFTVAVDAADEAEAIQTILGMFKREHPLAKSLESTGINFSHPNWKKQREGCRQVESQSICGLLDNKLELVAVANQNIGYVQADGNVYNCTVPEGDYDVVCFTSYDYYGDRWEDFPTYGQVYLAVPKGHSLPEDLRFVYNENDCMLCCEGVVGLPEGTLVYSDSCYLSESDSKWLPAKQVVVSHFCEPESYAEDSARELPCRDCAQACGLAEENFSKLRMKLANTLDEES